MGTQNFWRPWLVVLIGLKNFFVIVFYFFFAAPKEKVAKRKGEPLTSLSCDVVAAAVIHDGLNFVNVSI